MKVFRLDLEPALMRVVAKSTAVLVKQSKLKPVMRASVHHPTGYGTRGRNGLNAPIPAMPGTNLGSDRVQRKNTLVDAGLHWVTNTFQREKYARKLTVMEHVRTLIIT